MCSLIDLFVLFCMSLSDVRSNHFTVGSPQVCKSFLLVTQDIRTKSAIGRCPVIISFSFVDHGHHCIAASKKVGEDRMGRDRPNRALVGDYLFVKSFGAREGQSFWSLPSCSVFASFKQT